VSARGAGRLGNLKGSNTSNVFSGLTAAKGDTLTLTNTSKIDAIGMFHRQIGYSFGPLLWYVKGGAAVTDNKNMTRAQLHIAALLALGDRSRLGGQVRWRRWHRS